MRNKMDRQKILFSPLGGTDPISNFRDGSTSHICRIYKPDIVILYMSKEMYDYHVKDNRYLYCLDKLSELIDHKFEVKLIERPELTEVQDFDYFYQEFETLLREIHKEYEGEILLNISSWNPSNEKCIEYNGRSYGNQTASDSSSYAGGENQLSRRG